MSYVEPYPPQDQFGFDQGAMVPPFDPAMLVQYLLGQGQFADINAPAMSQGQLESVYGMIPQYQLSGKPLTTSNMTGLLSANRSALFDSALMGAAGPGGFTPESFAPQVMQTAVDNPVNDYLRNPNSLEGLIAQEIAKGGTPSTAIRLLRQLLAREDLDPAVKENLLLELPAQYLGEGLGYATIEPDGTGVDWEQGVRDIATNVGNAFADLPPIGQSGPKYNEAGEQITEGSNIEWQYDENGNPIALIETTTTLPKLARDYQELGLPSPYEEYTAEDFMSPEQIGMQEAYQGTQPVVDAAMARYLEAANAPPPGPQQIPQLTPGLLRGEPTSTAGMPGGPPPRTGYEWFYPTNEAATNQPPLAELRAGESQAPLTAEQVTALDEYPSEQEILNRALGENRALTPEELAIIDYQNGVGPAPAGGTAPAGGGAGFGPGSAGTSAATPTMLSALIRQALAPARDQAPSRADPVTDPVAALEDTGGDPNQVHSVVFSNANQWTPDQAAQVLDWMQDNGGLDANFKAYENLMLYHGAGISSTGTLTAPAGAPPVTMPSGGAISFDVDQNGNIVVAPPTTTPGTAAPTTTVPPTTIPDTAAPTTTTPTTTDPRWSGGDYLGALAELGNAAPPPQPAPLPRLANELNYPLGRPAAPAELGQILGQGPPQPTINGQPNPAWQQYLTGVYAPDVATRVPGEQQATPPYVYSGGQPATQPGGYPPIDQLVGAYTDFYNTPPAQPTATPQYDRGDVSYDQDAIRKAMARYALQPVDTGEQPQSQAELQGQTVLGGSTDRTGRRRPNQRGVLQGEEARRFREWDLLTDEQERMRQQTYTAETGRARGEAWKLRAQGVTPYTQTLMARRLVLMGAGLPNNGYFPGT